MPTPNLRGPGERAGECVRDRVSTEQTVVVTMNIPGGDDARWMPEFNLIVLAPHLDDLGRRRAVDEVQARWRREWIDLGA